MAGLSCPRYAFCSYVFHLRNTHSYTEWKLIYSIPLRTYNKKNQ